MIKEGFRAADQDSALFSDDLYQYLENTKIQILILLLATIIVYANSLSVPFYLDDYHVIVENSSMHSLASVFSEKSNYLSRATTYFTFALNYSLSQTSVASYHLVNILFHFLTGLGVFFLLRGLLQTPNIKHNTNEQVLLFLPFLAALIFLLHPLQTQAVTYIVQRMAVMAALFYVLSLTFYVFARIKNNQLIFFALSIVFLMLAFFTKQNTITIPACILLIEFLFFKKITLKNTSLFLVITVFSIVILSFILTQITGISFAEIDRFTRDAKNISRIEYFATQMPVIWHYIQSFFVPLNLHLDYDIPLQKSFFSAAVLIAFTAHIAVLTAAFWLAKKYPLISFAIIFYYLAHVVESGFVPLLDYAFEHRTYLPNMGLSILVSLLLLHLLSVKKIPSTVSVGVIFVLIASLSFLSISRNSIWDKPIAFFQNETRLSPGKERVWAELGKEYMKARNFEEALKAFGIALNLSKKGNSIEALPTTFLNTYLALFYTNQIKKAIYFESIMPVTLLKPHDRSVFYYMKGNRQIQSKQIPEAINSMRQAIELNSDNLDARATLGAVLLDTENKAEGIKLIQEVLRVNPKHKNALVYSRRI